MFIPWLIAHGLDVGFLYRAASQCAIAAFAWLDVLVWTFVVLALATRRLAVGERKLWFVGTGTCTVDVSPGLPLYLSLEEDL